MTHPRKRDRDEDDEEIHTQVHTEDNNVSDDETLVEEVVHPNTNQCAQCLYNALALNSSNPSMLVNWLIQHRHERHMLYVLTHFVRGQTVSVLRMLYRLSMEQTIVQEGGCLGIWYDMVEIMRLTLLASALHQGANIPSWVRAGDMLLQFT